MTATAIPSVEDAEAGVTVAGEQVEHAEAQLAAGGRGVTAAALHKLRDGWRHADLAARGARERAEQERQTARLTGLATIGEEVDRLAGADSSAMTSALRDVASACARVRELAATHDAAVAELVAAATDLGAEPKAPAGPRSTSAFVAVQGNAIMHGRTKVGPLGNRVADAVGRAVNGDVNGALAAVRVMTELPNPTRPDHLLRGGNGLLLAMTGPLDAGVEAQIRGGHVARLSEQDIDRYMAGELE